MQASFTRCRLSSRLQSYHQRRGALRPDSTVTMCSAGIEVDGIAPTNGLTGIFYWYLLYPIHELMFRGMLRRIAAALSR